LVRGRVGQADLSAVARSEASGAKADVAQLAERVLGKDEVTSSILVIGSNLRYACPTIVIYGWHAMRRLSTVACDSERKWTA
jgi:hypothetical protein